MDEQTASQALETAKYDCQSDHLRTGYGLHICQRCAVEVIHQYGDQVARACAEIAEKDEPDCAMATSLTKDCRCERRAAQRIATAILRHRGLT